MITHTTPPASNQQMLPNLNVGPLPMDVQETGLPITVRLLGPWLIVMAVADHWGIEVVQGPEVGRLYDEGAVDGTLRVRA